MQLRQALFIEPSSSRRERKRWTPQTGRYFGIISINNLEVRVPALIRWDWEEGISLLTLFFPCTMQPANCTKAVTKDVWAPFWTLWTQPSVPAGPTLLTLERKLEESEMGKPCWLYGSIFFSSLNPNYSCRSWTLLKQYIFVGQGHL